ncbi:hypothetical protein B0H63DRAFT_312496 [Podospora didyma]|uniref:OTU domain-containing protein n=1 Tax=Podospora didyma TaxID=330526 RepID=A0AAE0K6B6_9PEZI|nr:hypothetical protein B0H63DRAFT_312496 [Podospora didyma]
MDEGLEQVQARHRKEAKDLQSRITSKKKNATKKTRKGVNEECAELERQLKAKHEEELRSINGGTTQDIDGEGDDASDDEDRNAAGQQQEAVDGVTQQLRDTAISSESRPPTAAAVAEVGGGLAASPSPSQQQENKSAKRNRQKERLARRAAEIEAAAAAAESEAKGMKDHRGIEKAYMLKEFAAHSLKEKEIAPDGHCLFSAVADQLAANGIPVVDGPNPPTGALGLPYKIVRRAAAEYMESHADDFAGFLEEPLDDYVAKIRDTAEWGGQLELAALANAYSVEIKVVQDGRTEVVRPQTEEKHDGLKTLWLAYYRHGYGLGEHYNSLRKAATAAAAS